MLGLTNSYYSIIKRVHIILYNYIINGIHMIININKGYSYNNYKLYNPKKKKII